MEANFRALSTPEVLYLDLLKRCLTRILFPDRRMLGAGPDSADFILEERLEGKDWPTDAETMIGLRRLENLESCVTNVVVDKVPGDLVETGVWRGGASILMRAVLKAYGDQSRRVWVVDSFQGLPKPDTEQFPQDVGDIHHSAAYLAVSLEKVKANFSRYGLLDEQVSFLEGWFKDTLPQAPIDRIAVLRLDGDMYESTMEVLMYLYDKVSPGGFVIIDDYGALPNCRAAVEDFRRSRNIVDPIERVDWTGAFWRKGRVPPARSKWSIWRKSDRT
jgi:hypothetical protein